MQNGTQPSLSPVKDKNVLENLQAKITEYEQAIHQTKSQYAHAYVSIFLDVVKSLVAGKQTLSLAEIASTTETAAELTHQIEKWTTKEYANRFNGALVPADLITERNRLLEIQKKLLADALNNPELQRNLDLELTQKVALANAQQNLDVRNPASASTENLDASNVEGVDAKGPE